MVQAVVTASIKEVKTREEVAVAILLVAEEMQRQMVDININCIYHYEHVFIYI